MPTSSDQLADDKRRNVITITGRGIETLQQLDAVLGVELRTLGLDRNELGALLVQAGLGSARDRALISLPGVERVADHRSAWR